MPSTTSKRSPGRPAGENGSVVSLYLSNEHKALLDARATTKNGRTKALGRVINRFTHAVASARPALSAEEWRIIVAAVGKPVQQGSSRGIIAALALPEALAAKLAALSEIEAAAVLDAVDLVLALPDRMRPDAIAQLSVTG